MNKCWRNILCIALLCVSMQSHMDAQSAKQLLYNFCPDTAISSVIQPCMQMTAFL